MTRRSIERRLARLEQRGGGGGGMYAVHLGDEDFVDWDGQHVPLDEWQRRYPESVIVDIGGMVDGHHVKTLRGVHMDEL